jgi:outer membrane lipoprotein-sorting protein
MSRKQAAGTADTDAALARPVANGAVRVLLAGLVGLVGVTTTAGALTADEIIERMEANQTHSTSIMEGRMVISDRFGDRASTYIVHSEGADRFLVEFTSRNEEGQRVLRRDDSLYLYYPDARETIRIQGAALRDNLLGSDISYEDMTGGRGLRENYRFELLGEESVDGHGTYKVRLTARSTNVAYPMQVLWVDREVFVLRRSEQFARSGRLLKTTTILETTRQAGYHFPTRIRVVDETRRSSGTEMIIENARLGVSLPAGIFSLEELSW